ncbi:MAG TPA: BrnT family toxin [Alphaproteobacteria bacterium]|nr:BrnT family toxin [Alphaproteobacteria bacterium]
MPIKIIFDPAKDAANRVKHGLSLAEAGRLEWDTALIERDDRRDYGEARMLAIGYIGHRLHFVVFVERDGTRRVISLRKTNEREDRRYAQT